MQLDPRVTKHVELLVNPLTPEPTQDEVLSAECRLVNGFQFGRLDLFNEKTANELVEYALNASQILHDLKPSASECHIRSRLYTPIAPFDSRAVKDVIEQDAGFAIRNADFPWPGLEAERVREAEQGHILKAISLTLANQVRHSQIRRRTRGAPVYLNPLDYVPDDADYGIRTLGRKDFGRDAGRRICRNPSVVLRTSMGLFAAIPWGAIPDQNDSGDGPWQQSMLCLALPDESLPQGLQHAMRQLSKSWVFSMPIIIQHVYFETMKSWFQQIEAENPRVMFTNLEYLMPKSVVDSIAMHKIEGCDIKTVIETLVASAPNWQINGVRVDFRQEEQFILDAVRCALDGVLMR